MKPVLTVLGLGNILMSDEGIGVRLMEAVRDSRRWPGEIRFVDGGAGGLNLLNVIEEAGRLVVLDAADMGLAPGRHRVIGPEQLAGDDERRLSLHDVSFAQTLDLCRRFLRAPAIIRILAVQPMRLGYSRQLSPELAAALPELALAAAELIRNLG
jgi:hydrogenase maturation protease